jgi:glycerol uptake facilitator protein
VTLIKNKSGKTFSREALREEYTSILPASILGRFYRVRSWRYEQAPGANSGALIIGFLVAAIGASMSYLEAWAINPARDFGPRLFCYLAGWGNSALPSPDNYWYVPIVAPLIGGAVGGGAYQVLIHPLQAPRRCRGRAHLERGGRIARETCDAAARILNSVEYRCLETAIDLALL